MSKQNHLLKTLTIILFFIILFETIYLFFSLKGEKSKNQSKLPIPTIRPQAAKGWDDPKNIDWIYQGINPNHAIDGKVLYSLSYYNKDVLTSSLLTNTHNGVITQLDTKGGKAFFDYYNYQALIRVGSSLQSTVTDVFYLSADDLSKTKIVDTRDKQLKITDLKIGDRVKIEDSINMLTSLPIPGAQFGEYKTKSWGYNLIQMKIIRVSN